MPRNPFSDHPRSVGESYSRHARSALRYAFLLALASGAAAIHALLPFLFPRSASAIVGRLHRELHERAAGAPATAASSPDPR